jgi:pyruvate formate lyase activating enzyme
MLAIGGLQEITLIDYPGRLAATVFLIGCNFKCPFCYSRELVLPELIKKQPRLSGKKFFAFLKEKQGLLQGVVVCGGEPTIHGDLPEFIKKIKDLGFLVKLDTNGSNPEMLEKLIKEKLVDYFAMDVKHCSQYDKATGIKADLAKIKKSVEIIKNSGVDYEFRTTVVPTIHTKEDIVVIAKFLGPAKKYYLQNFRSEKTIDPKFLQIKPYSDEYLLEIKKSIASFFETCAIR